jgi:glycosyltransferase involved in cell wall biosynthesis
LLKIAIYSGTIPSTTFIENLIKGISTKHKVLLFGKLKSLPVYNSKKVQIHPTYSNIFKNIVIAKWCTFLLLVKYPKRFQMLWNQVKPIKGIYNKYHWWSRYVPVLLHLPDIFHVQWAKDIEKWYFLKEKLGCKIGLSLRGAHINYSPIADPQLAASYKKYFSKIDAFHAVSDAIGIEAQKYGADAAKITIIHSPISKTTIDLFKQPNAIKNNKLKIISVGRFHWVKGYKLALDACKLLKEQQIPFLYTIVAGDIIPEELLFQRNQLGLQKEVIFTSLLPQKEVFEKIQESDVLLLPSYKEGIANVVLEAMALGTLVISTDGGGMEEVIKQGETGWLVPVRNPQAIAKALLEVQNTSLEERSKIINNAHAFVKEQFNAEKVISEFCEFYDRIYKNSI